MEFNSELVIQYTPMIRKIVREKLYNCQSSDFIDDFDDHFQDSIEYLKYAADTYDPTKGCKESTYVCKVLQSRLGNKKNKAIRHNSNGTLSFSEINNKFSVNQDVKNFEDVVFSLSVSGKSSTHNPEDALNMWIDAKRLSEDLTGIKKVIFEEHYIKRKKIHEVVEMYPDLKYHHIKKHLTQLRQIIEVLVKGNVNV